MKVRITAVAEIAAGPATPGQPTTRNIQVSGVAADGEPSVDRVSSISIVMDGASPNIPTVGDHMDVTVVAAP